MKTTILNYLGSKRFELMANVTNYYEPNNWLRISIKGKNHNRVQIIPLSNGLYQMYFYRINGWTIDNEVTRTVTGERLKEVFTEVTGLYIILG